MASKTTNYNLDMPGYNEIADIDVINGNMDKIDVQMKKNADSAQQSKDIVSDEYSATNTYAVGDYCIRENVLYKCKTAITTGEAFDSSKWEQTTCGTEFKELNSNLDGLSYDENAGGKNLLDLPNPYSITGTYGKYITAKVKKNTNYTLSAGSVTSSVYQGIIVKPINSDTTIIEKYVAPYIIPFNSGDNETIRIFFYSGNETSGTSVYYDIQLEEGITATEYEPYIPSVKMLSDEVSAQNESLADYGLDNKCNSLEQGYATWWDANVEQSPDYIHTDFISVSNGDLITIKGGLNASHVIFYNASKEFISFKTDVNKVSVPSGVAFVRANFYRSGITPINVNIGIYVENQIDVLKNDLEWKLLADNVAVGTSTNVVSGAREYYVIAKYNTINITTLIPSIVLGKTIFDGYYSSESDNARIQINTTTSALNLANFIYGGSVKDDATYSVYYR